MKRFATATISFLSLFITATVLTSCAQNKSPSESIATMPSTVATKLSTTEVVTTPSSTASKNKIIVIDPGHASNANLAKEQNAPGSTIMKIKDGGGATGVVTKTPEYKVNMNIALKLKDVLKSRGYTVYMTKTQNSLSLGNIERANIWNKYKANLVIRIHADSSTSKTSQGASILVPAAICTKSINAESLRCGKLVLNKLIAEVGMKSRGIIYSKDMTGFNWSKVPVILVEAGFLSNPAEDKLLSSASYEAKIATALADGIDIAEK